MNHTIYTGLHSEYSSRKKNKTTKKAFTSKKKPCKISTSQTSKNHQKMKPCKISTQANVKYCPCPALDLNQDLPPTGQSRCPVKLNQLEMLNNLMTMLNEAESSKS